MLPLGGDLASKIVFAQPFIASNQSKISKFMLKHRRRQNGRLQRQDYDMHIRINSFVASSRLNLLAKNVPSHFHFVLMKWPHTNTMMFACISHFKSSVILSFLSTRFHVFPIFFFSFLSFSKIIMCACVLSEPKANQSAIRTLPFFVQEK